MDEAKNQLKWGPLDVVVIGLLVSFCVYVFHRVDTVLIYEWDWSVIPGYLFRWDEEANKFLPNLLIKGLFTTLRISFWALILSSILGVLLGIARTSERLLPRMIGWMYVEFIRNIPPVPFLFYFIFLLVAKSYRIWVSERMLTLWHHRRSSFWKLSLVQQTLLRIFFLGF